MLDRLVERLGRSSRTGATGGLRSLWFQLDPPFRLIAPAVGALAAALLLGARGRSTVLDLPWTLLVPLPAVVAAGLWLRARWSQVVLAGLYSTVLLLGAILCAGIFWFVEDMSAIAGSG